MISRRILRIKVMQALYAYFKHADGSTIRKSEKELLFSIQKAFDQYHYLFLLILDISNFAYSRMELAKKKRIPTADDLNPNTKFIDNSLVAQLRINDQLLRYAEASKISWVRFPDLIKRLYTDITESDLYTKYMSEETRSYNEDKTFICNVYKDIISQNELLFQSLEEQSIYWNDETDFMIGIIIKTFKKFRENEGEHAKLFPLYKSKDDENFSKRLLRKVIMNHHQYTGLIKEYSKNWDIERIAFMDILFLQMAIAEVIEFSTIPVKVTLNEYLELSKYYSTHRSSIFINGILDKIFTHLKKTNQIKKHGRGLIGDE